jgi:anti-sigma B factor antagonist
MTRQGTTSPDRRSEISDDLLRFEFARDGTEETLYVTGELDVSTAPALEHAVARTLDGQGGEYHLDVGGMTFMDSTGAGALMRIHRRFTGFGRRLVIISPTRQVCAVLEILGLDQVLDVRR